VSDILICTAQKKTLENSVCSLIAKFFILWEIGIALNLLAMSEFSPEAGK